MAANPSEDHDVPVPQFELTDWRRRVQALYARVRAEESPEASHALWREGRDELFGMHPQSPLPEGDPLRSTGIPYWPYDPTLRWTVPLERNESPERRSVATGSTEVTDMLHLGWITLPLQSEPRLAVWWLEQYASGVFVPVRDGTAGTSSYGAGRYLLDTTKGADLGGSDTALIVDLNFLYHPSCRYDPQWICPLAPSDNTISIPIEAGERMA